MLGPSIPNAIIAIGVAFTPFLGADCARRGAPCDADAVCRSRAAAGATDLNLILAATWRPMSCRPSLSKRPISLAFAVLAEASLSFLGLGTQPPQSSWG